MLLVTLLLGACAPFKVAIQDSVGYGAQALQGHLGVLSKSRPIENWLLDPLTPASLRSRLTQVEQIRAFASRELGLPDNRTYRSYADLQRPFAVWNVFAAPELSLKLEAWCFPVLGCLSYRGYFDQEAAQGFAKRLVAQGREVHVGGIPAYSTLGLTADPVLNTFIDLPDGELARLLFHELAHQVIYVPDDSTFNESFATAVEIAGVELWLNTRDPATRERYTEHEARRRDFQKLLRSARKQLDVVYQNAGTDDLKRAQKLAVQESILMDYRRLRDGQWGGYAGYDRFFAQPPNNAQLAAVGTYDELVPDFLALFCSTPLETADSPAFTAFFRRVRELAAAPRDARRAALRGAVRFAQTNAAGAGAGKPGTVIELGLCSTAL